MDLKIITEDDDTDGVLFEVEDEADDSILELDHLPGHRSGEPVNTSNAVTDLQDTPNLSEDLKSDLQESCEEAASGDEEAVRDAARDVCIRIVEETVPEGQARDQALETCEQAAP